MNNEARLYDIADELIQLQDLMAQVQEAEDEDDENIESLKEALNNAFDQLGERFTDKVHAVLKVYRNHVAMAEAAKAEAERLNRLKKSAEGQANWLRDYLLTQMKRAKVDKVKTLTGTVSIRKGGESVVITDDTLLPEGTYNIPTDIIPDKNEIKRRLKAGEEVPGAKLETGPDAIQIR